MQENPQDNEPQALNQQQIDKIMEDSDLQVLMLLDEYKAADVKSSRSGSSGNRLRVNFTVQDREVAKKCFDDLSARKSLNQGEDTLKIFLVMDESVFVKYGDIEAEKFYAA